MNKKEQADVLVRMLSIFQTLPILGVASEEASAVKDMIKGLYQAISKEIPDQAQASSANGLQAKEAEVVV